MEKVLVIKSKHTTTERDKRGNGTTVTKTAAAAHAQTTTKIMQVTHMIKAMPISKNVYEQRKSQKSMYSELFSALFRLPDKQVQQRVLNAINGNKNAESAGDGGGNEILCNRCKSKVSRNNKFVDTGTQTEPPVGDLKKYHITKENRTQSPTKTTTGSTSVCDNNKSIIKLPLTSQTTETTMNVDEKKNSQEDCKEALEEVVTSSSPPPVQTIKRGRKRRTCVPQVVKHSHAEQVQQEREDKQLTPILKKKRKSEAQQSNHELPSKIVKSNDSPSRRNSNLYDVDLEGIDLDFLRDWEMESTNQEEYILKKMAIEFLQSERYEDGLLPIHDAILKNDIYHLQRQIFVWTKLKCINLNNLLTNTDEDCLELAITNDCIPEIMSILLRTDLALNTIYECSNNVIHLAIINNIDENCLLQLMERVDLKLLLERNDEGYTPIHIAVRHNLYKSCEIILNKVDQRTLGSSFYTRNLMNHNDDEVMNIKEGKIDQFEMKSFSKFYEISCDQLDQLLKPICLTKLNLKRKLLDMGETRGGNTALLYAVENEMEHFTYFLLAHLSNPTTENHSGQSAKSFHYEFARTLQLSLKVARTMDKIISILVKFAIPD